jgi:hypothetical protein
MLVGLPLRWAPQSAQGARARSGFVPRGALPEEPGADACGEDIGWVGERTNSAEEADGWRARGHPSQREMPHGSNLHIRVRSSLGAPHWPQAPPPAPLHVFTEQRGQHTPELSAACSAPVGCSKDGVMVGGTEGCGATNCSGAGSPAGLKATMGAAWKAPKFCKGDITTSDACDHVCMAGFSKIPVCGFAVCKIGAVGCN